MKAIIGIAGPMGSGKTTAADMICSAFTSAGVEAGRESFATPLKLMLRHGLRLTHEQVNGSKKHVVDDRYGVTPRHMIQTLGTEWGRQQVASDLWVKVAAMRCELLEGVVVFDDVRFPEELEWIRSQGGVVVYLTSRGGSSLLASPHLSEVAINSSNKVLTLANNGTPDVLRQKLNDLLHLPKMAEALCVY